MSFEPRHRRRDTPHALDQRADPGRRPQVGPARVDGHDRRAGPGVEQAPLAAVQGGEVARRQRLLVPSPAGAHPLDQDVVRGHEVDHEIRTRQDPVAEAALLGLLRRAGFVKMLGSYPMATTPHPDEKGGAALLDSTVGGTTA